MQRLAVLFDGFEAAEKGVVIYGLADPRELERVRYVGQAARPSARYEGHIRDGRRPYDNPRCRWLHSLAVEDLGPTMLFLEHVMNQDRVAAREARWIERLRGIGQADLNVAKATAVARVPWRLRR
jgi:hypothetical protein